jgi:4-amino-4-deoxy-L-arabinose transferase-like glycosyltransferase
MALTPVAALMFRFNNPDALLVLLLTVSAYAVVRALENGRSKWLVLAGVVLGFAFLAKMLQAFLVVPAFAVAYLWAGPPRLRKRIWQLLLAGAGILVGSGWWLLIAEVVPAADRPYFGGSTNNNILQLAIGYNGLGRLTGSETGSVGGGGRGGGGGGGGFGGATGITRLFSSEFGGQISWLLPAALISLAGMLWVSRRAARTDRTRAAALLWGGWLVCTGVVFSYMSGIIHPYYMVALAPAIAAGVAVGAMALWERRLGWFGRITAAVTVGVTVWWAVALLDRSPSWLPWLRWVIVVAGVAAAGSILAAPWLGSLGRPGSHGGRRPGLAGWLAGIPVVLALVAGLTGPAAYAIDTVATTHTGSLPTAGPQTASAGGPGGGAGGGVPGGRGTGTGGPPAGFGTGSRTGGTTGGTAGTGGPGGTGTAPPGGTGTAGGTAPSRTGAAAGGTGGPGGLGGNTQVSSALVKLLENGATGYTWVAATVGSQEAAPLELATGGEPVMAIGGFNGTDPSPTLAEFKALVAEHKIHYFIGANSQSFGGGQRSSAIASWVASHFTKETIGGTTVYDLTKATSL